MESLGKVDPPCCTVEDVETSLPFDEVIQILEAPAQEEVSKVSCFPFQIFNDSLSYDVESEEVLDVFTPSCYNEDDDFVDNIEEFIHVGKRNWDVIGYDMGIPFTTLRVTSKSCLYHYHMKLLINLTFGNKDMT
jgi:hypothetical protein